MKNKIQELQKKLTSNQQKYLFFGGIVGVMLILILIIALIMGGQSHKNSYEDLENKLETAATKYLKEHPDLLPSSTNPTVVVDATTLMEQKYIKNINKIVKDESCSANVVVDYIESSYQYQAFVTCENYKTQLLIDTLKNNNKISQTREGLYEMNNEYVYRGQNPNNYLSFADRLWRIVKMDENGNILIIVSTDKADLQTIWDNRYNTEKDTQRGINNFLLSRIFTNLTAFYDENLSSYASYLSDMDLCVGKRVPSSNDKSGNLECSEKIEKQKIGLLSIYDYLNASLDGLCQTTVSKECQNYNYLADNKFKWWTMTANMETTYDVFSVTAQGRVESLYANVTAQDRFVLSLKNDVLYKSGDGSKENPYEIR